MRDIKQWIRRIPLNSGEIFFLICWFILIVSFYYLRFEIAISGVSFFFSLSSVLADSTLIILPFLFLKGKKRFFVLIPIIIIAILILVNVLYYRNFGDLIGGISYVSDFMDVRVIEGTISSFTKADLILLSGVAIPLLCFGLFLNKRKIAQDRISSLFKKLMVYTCIVCWIISLFGSCRRFALYRDKHTVGEAIDNMLNFNGSWIDKYNAFNFTGYGSECIWRIATKSRKVLSEDESERIRKYLASKSENRIDRINENKKENLIIIVVESLQSNILSIPEAREIMPTLDSLARDSTTLYVENCRHLAGPGRSSDAQFVINTGLVPLRHEAFVSNYAEGDYPSIAKAFRGETKEIIGEESRCWFHSVTTLSYGYDSIESGMADKVPDQDSIIFRAALKTIPKMQHPFFLFISTLSMHDPFLNNMVTDNINNKLLDSYTDHRDKEYLRRVAFFDSQLSFFISELKRNGEYENTLIVIVGDHEVNRNTVSKRLYHDKIPLFILGEGNRQYRKKDVSQLDIFPTILSILGTEYVYERFDVKYSGLGKSLFDLSVSDSPNDTDYEISSLIIQSK